MTKKASAHSMSAGSGRVYQRNAVATTVIAAKTPSQGFRRPVRSAIEPRIGLSTAIRTPDTASAWPHAAVPSIGLSATAREK